MDKSETKEPKINKQADVFLLEDDLVVINDTQYRLIENHDNGFDKEKIEERYNNVLDKYDYIVGDWGYDQLRFKGFYIDKRIESNLDNKISHLEDYLLEYCNFGCAYFILERVDKLPLTKPKHHRQKPKNAARANGKNNHNVHGKNGHNAHNKKQNSSHRTHQTQKIMRRNQIIKNRNRKNGLIISIRVSADVVVKILMRLRRNIVITQQSQRRLAQSQAQRLSKLEK